MEFTFRPIERWPGQLAASRKRSAFKSSYNATLKLLDQELRHLKADGIVLQVAMSADQIRLDGKPRAGAYVSHPGVILSFDSKFGPLSYPCDTFDNWQDNLRAIGLALESLRAIKRYGVGQSGEQYRGWSALPPGRPVEPKMTRSVAYELLVKHSNSEYTVKDAMIADDIAKLIYRYAVKATHPDRSGDAEAFKRVQEAAEVLGIK